MACPRRSNVLNAYINSPHPTGLLTMLREQRPIEVPILGLVPTKCQKKRREKERERERERRRERERERVRECVCVSLTTSLFYRHVY